MYVRNKDARLALPAEGRTHISHHEGDTMSTIAIHPTVAYSRAAAATRPAPMRLTRRGRIIVGTLIALPIVIGAYFIGLGAPSAGADSAVSTTTFEYLTVMPGDTLWAIAGNLADGADTQGVIAAIVELNQLDSMTVQPGQQLAIPAEFSN
jgi:Tfp pilus assembly protein FimV